MQAAIVEQPGHLVLRDIPKPTPGKYEALCELLYGATCTGTDQHLIRFDPPFCYWVKLPAILGHESIGRVVEIGPAVRHLAVGDLVTRVGAPPVDDLDVAWGGFAEFGLARDWRAMKEDDLPANEWQESTVNNRLPADFDPRAATMVITWRETLSYLHRMGLTEGRSIAILGSGGNGLSFLAHATHVGASPRVMIGSPTREDAAMRAGADTYIDYRAEDVKEQAMAVNAEGFDFVIDAVGKAPMADLGLSLLAAGGTLGIYGMDEVADIRLNPGQARGTFTVNKNHYDELETHDEVVALVRQGKLDAGIWLDLDHPYELADIESAFRAVRQREQIKALVRLRG